MEIELMKYPNTLQKAINKMMVDMGLKNFNPAPSLLEELGTAEEPMSNKRFFKILRGDTPVFLHEARAFSKWLETDLDDLFPETKTIS